MVLQRPRILLIETNRALQGFVYRTLSHERFDVVRVANQEDALSILADEHIDLVLLDTDFPNSMRLCEILRQHAASPLIAFGAEHTSSAALAHGADDVLSMPCSPDRLLARIRLALRHHPLLSQPLPQKTLTVGNLEIDLRAHLVRRSGQPIPLSRTDWALLDLLARNAGQVLTHRMLLEHVWGDSYSDEHGYLRTYINRLRSKLEDDPKNPRYLLTESRIGYRFATPAPASAGTHATSPETTPLTNLPSPPTLLIGREAETAAVATLIQQPDVRLLTLTGPGGVGKTRLALEVACEVQAAFKRGVCFVSLAAARTPDMVITAIAKALQISETGGRPLAKRLRDELAAGELLLLLDNFEQVIDSAPLLGELLAAAPGLTLFVTSRARLHLYGEHEFVVRPLACAVPRDFADPTLVAQQPAIRLFENRARAAQPDFKMDFEQVRDIAEICARLDGLPLAIELAAAWVKILPPAAIVARLSDRLALLTGGPRDMPVRHQTLRNMLDWSYDLLDEHERTLFRQLAVFVSGANTAAIERVCAAQAAPTHTLKCLHALVSASLVLQQEASGEPRFGMLETVQSYAAEQLERAGELSNVQKRHAAWYLELAETAACQAQADQRQSFDQLEREHDNLRAALEWAATHDQSELLLRLCCALWNFWHVHGHQSEGRRWLAEALSCGEHQVLALRATALYGIGWLCRDQGDYTQAMAHHRESLALFRALGDKHGMAEALRGVGELALSQGNAEQAKTLFKESLQLSQALGDAQGESWSLNHLGRVALEQGAYDSARELFEGSLAAFRNLGVQAGISWSLHNLGRAALEHGSYEHATTLMTESLAVFSELGDKTGMAWSLHNLGRVWLEQGLAEPAAKKIEQALDLFNTLADKTGMAWSHYSLGRCALLRNDAADAEAQLLLGLELFRAVCDELGMQRAYDYLRTLTPARYAEVP